MMGIDYYSFVRACFQIMLPHHLPMTKKKIQELRPSYKYEQSVSNLETVLMQKIYRMQKQSSPPIFLVQTLGSSIEMYT